MISVVLSWIVILIAAYTFGSIMVKTVYRKYEETLWHLDVYLVCGLMILNIYAEYFSIIYKVGILSCFVLSLMGLALLVCYRIWNRGKESCEVKKLREVSAYQWILIVFVGIATLAWTMMHPQHYDTSLYHFQAIKWIEEYGVVPGLGNLHNRFAYNSAFMALQALFSFSWLKEPHSMHTVNGFICCMFMCYALCTNNILKRKRVQLSDLLKLVMIIYICMYREYISSPSSDTFALLLILYICAKWNEFAEWDVKDTMPYALLGILCAYVVTLKLSAIACGILIIYPLVMLLKRKQWLQISGNLLAGFCVTLPWLIRNVLISGYLLYPYPQIDMFNVDWKMPVAVLTFDSREIMAYGRGLNNAALYETPFKVWFPHWFSTNSGWQTLIIAGLLSTLLVAGHLLYKIVRSKKIDIRKDLFYIYSIAGLLIWIFTAPLLRYGVIYLFIPICELVMIVVVKTELAPNKLQTISEITAIVVLVPWLGVFAGKWEELKKDPWLWQIGYDWVQTEKIDLLDNVDIWFPIEGDQGSYDVFPCVPYKNMVEKVELRGDDMSDGFRIKKEFMELNLNEYGTEW